MRTLVAMVGLVFCAASVNAAPLGVCPPKAKGSLPSSTLRFKAEIALESGKAFPYEVAPGGNRLVEDQFLIEVEEGAENLWVELAPEDQQKDLDLYVRFGQPVAVTQTPDGPMIETDAGSTSYLGYEEVGIWGQNLQVGTYYIGIVSYVPEGSNVTITATVDGAYVELTSGVPSQVRTPSDGSDPSDFTVQPDGQQFRFLIPDEATDLYVRYDNDDLSAETLVALRYHQPNVFTDQGFMTDTVIDSAGGFQDACFTGQEVIPGSFLYLLVMTDGGRDVAAVGTITILVNECIAAIGVGETRADTAPAVPDEEVNLLGTRQYKFFVENDQSGIAVTLTPEEPEDLDMFVRLDMPVEIDPDGNVVADFTGTAPGTDPEVITISCEEIAVAEYYVVVANPNRLPVRYTLSVMPGEPCGVTFVRGDVNTDGKINIADPVALLEHLFGGGRTLKCEDAGDGNDDGKLNIADAVAILQHLFGNGGPLPAPFPEPGLDSTEDGLGCSCFPPAGTQCPQ